MEIISLCIDEGDEDDRSMFASGRGARRLVRRRSTVRRKGFEVGVELEERVERATERIGDMGSTGGEGNGKKRAYSRIEESNSPKIDDGKGGFGLHCRE